MSVEGHRHDQYSQTDHTHTALTSPALSGTPTAPTAAVDTNTTQIATTAFVVGQAASVAPVGGAAAVLGTSLRYARQDHVHPMPALTGAVTSTAGSVATSFQSNPSFTGTGTFSSTVSASGLAGSLLSAAAPTRVAGAAATGTSAVPARDDHVHSAPFTFMRVSSGSTSTATTGNGTTPTGFTTIALTAGRTYEFEVVGMYQSSVTTAALVSVLQYPALTAGAAFSQAFTNTAVVSQVGSPAGLAASPTTITHGLAGVASTNLNFSICGFLIPSSSGNFQYTFRISSAGTATIVAGTYMIVREVA